MSKAFDAHLDALRAGEVTRTNSIGLRKAFTTDARRADGWSAGVTAPKVTTEQIERATYLIAKNKPVVLGELHETGLALLRSKRNRKALASVVDIVPDVVRFRLVDYEMRGRWGEYFVPVYRAQAEDGRSFDFINIPWQSGGNGPEVVRQ
jgi:hypothetical protein